MPTPHRLSLANLGLTLWLDACRLVAWPLGALAYLSARVRHPAALVWLNRCRGGATVALRRIAFVRLARRSLLTLLKTGADRLVRARVRVTGENHLPQGGCVVAIVHSPWNRILGRWACAEDFALLMAHRRWRFRLGAFWLPPTFVGLRRAVRALRAGRRVVVVVDDFVTCGGSIAQFLGYRVRVSQHAARLAALAGVPIVPVTQTYRAGQISLRIRTPFAVERDRDPAEVTQLLLHRLERIARRRPEEWSDLLPFFDKAPTRWEPSQARITVGIPFPESPRAMSVPRTA